MFYVVKLLTTSAGADGSKIEGVHATDSAAMTQYHSLCAALHNDHDTEFIAVMNVLEANGNCKIKEIIDHLPQPQPEPEEG